MYGHPEGEGAGMNREMGTDVYTLFVHVCVKLLTHVRLFVTPWTVAHYTPLFMNSLGKHYSYYV